MLLFVNAEAVRQKRADVVDRPTWQMVVLPRWLPFCLLGLLSSLKGLKSGGWERGVLPYMGCTGMCRSTGYGFCLLESGTGSTNQHFCLEQGILFALPSIPERVFLTKDLTLYWFVCIYSSRPLLPLLSIHEALNWLSILQVRF